HPALVTLHLLSGDADQATKVADEVRKGDVHDALIAEQIAGAFAESDETETAQRWYSIGLRWSEEGTDDDDESIRDMLLLGRLLVVCVERQVERST
ncbi:hypothetical protein ACC691_38390, partial [Rhizobium johnstonii]|uniref:hypothetical protein n=1 Tax=Rhizobium johnstonii TaxID=3019933 RepID=UPI003F9BC7AF